MQKFFSKGNKSTNWLSIIGAAFFLLGVYTILYYTPHQIGVSHDSINYLDVANNLLEGNGFYKNFTGRFEPLTTYQPFYPFILSIFSLNFFEPVAVARYLNAILYGLNVVLGGILAYRASGKNSLAYILTMAGLLSSHTLLISHLHAWTEPLFTALLFTGFLWLDKFLLNQYSFKVIFFCGLFLSLAVLTRYAGFIAIPVTIIIMLLFRRTDLKVNLKSVGFFLFPQMVVLGAWLIRNALLVGNPVDRNVQWFGLKASKLNQMKGTLKSWFFDNGFDDEIGFVLSFVMILIILISGAFYTFYNRSIKFSKLPGILSIFSLSYWLFVLATIMFVDPIVPLDDRLLLPLFYAIVILICSLVFNNNHQFIGQKAIKVLGLFVGIFWIIHLWDHSMYFKKKSYENGKGFNSLKYKNSQFIDKAKNLSNNTPCYAPTFDYIYLHYLLDRPVKPINALTKFNKAKESQKAYLLYLNDCCEENSLPDLPIKAVNIKEIMPKKIYKIIKEQ